MDYILGVSKEKLENYILERLEERFNAIVWGTNCDSLREALTFGHDWLLAGTQDSEIKEAMADYLLKERFRPKAKSLIGSSDSKHLIGGSGTEWTFPDNPQNGLFLAVKEVYESFYQESLGEIDRAVKTTILHFAESTDFHYLIHFENQISKKLMQDNLAEYNRALVLLRNRNKNESREFIGYEFLCDGNAVLMYKYRDSKMYKYGPGYDNLEIIKRDAEGAYNYDLSCKLLNLFKALNYYLAACRYRIVPKMFKCFVPSDYARDIQNVLEAQGLKVTFFPMHDEAQYYKAGYDIAMYIPIYIEVDRIKFTDIENFGVAVMQNYRQFCNSYM